MTLMINLTKLANLTRSINLTMNECIENLENLKWNETYHPKPVLLLFIYVSHISYTSIVYYVMWSTPVSQHNKYQQFLIKSQEKTKKKYIITGIEEEK